LILAAQTSCLSLALHTDKSKVAPSTGTTAGDLFRGN
jgi:hypothetical protein